MYRIAVLGTENTHALGFVREILDENEKRFSIVGIYGYDKTANEKILSLFRQRHLDTECAESPDAFLGRVDAVIITARHGDLHYDYALPYLRKGVTAWIDKPFCIDLKKAEEMVHVAKSSGSVMLGGSQLVFADAVKSLRNAVSASPSPIGQLLGGSVTAPINYTNPYGGFYFYSQHLVEIAFEVFGQNIRDVWAQEKDGRVDCVFRYDRFSVSGTYLPLWYHYHISVHGENTSLSRHITPEQVAPLQKAELDELFRALETGKAERPVGHLYAPLSVLYAMNDSIFDGRFHEIKPLCF